MQPLPGNYNQSQLNKQRKDKFSLILTLPTIMKPLNVNDFSGLDGTTINGNALQFSVFGSLIPDISVPAEVVPYSGQQYKVSSHARTPYDDINVKFTIDNQWLNWWVIWSWLDVINSAKEDFYNAANPNREIIPPPAEYQSTITVLTRDEFDKPIMQFNYTKAFPTGLGGFDANNRDSEEAEVWFSFAFSQFLPRPVQLQPA